LGVGGFVICWCGSLTGFIDHLAVVSGQFS
jgi:hypothetical protein